MIPPGICAVRLCDGGVEAPAWDTARGYWYILTQD